MQINSRPTSVLKVPFGLKNGIVVEPSALPSGKDPECLCPGCKSILVVRRGTRRPHFAHFVGSATLHCVETALHAAAKQILLTEKWLCLPEHTVVATATYNRMTHRRSTIVVQPKTRVVFTHCVGELTMQAIRPDVVGYYESDALLPGGPIAIEILVTHAVDEFKRAKIVAMNLLTLEIDLNGVTLTPDLAEIRQCVLEQSYAKHWIHIPEAASVHQAMQDELDTMVAKNLAADAEELLRVQEQRERQQRDAPLRAPVSPWAVRFPLALSQQSEEPLATQARRRLLTEDEENAAAVRRRTFRLKPSDVKETLIRKQLGIHGEWPAVLSFACADNTAILCPPHLWQAAFFAAFVHKHLGEEYEDCDREAFLNWMMACFDTTVFTKVQSALTAYLLHLQNAGFMSAAVVARGRALVLLVLSDDWQSKEHMATQHANVPGRKVSFDGNPPASNMPPLTTRHWMWSASQADLCQNMAALRSRGSLTTAEECVLHYLERIGPCTTSPLAWAVEAAGSVADVNDCLAALQRLHVIVTANRKGWTKYLP